LAFISPKEDEQLKGLFKEYYESGKTKNNRLYNKEQELNERLKSVSEAFNKIYTNKTNQKYDFVFDFKDDGILLIIKDNQRAIDLDKQSAGFKWFFNFFLNILSDEKLNNGDIVILDEPATNLHPAAQIELVDQLNTYGREHGILFIMSTHSPFMIDPDYFDQLRIVTRIGLYADVQRFTLNIDSKKDVLLPIKSSLTVDKHIIINPNNKTIYIEGITDYNYLTAFKTTKEKYRNLNFLPINGVKDSKLAQTLMNLSKNPIALFDSDHAGLKASEQLSKNNIEVINLNEINTAYKQIEDLFTEEERGLYCFNEDEEKSYKLSSYFKNNFKSIFNKLNKETKDNFYQLLDRISE
jgi:ABC-type multidrug transport system ATPase subunit